MKSLRATLILTYALVTVFSVLAVLGSVKFMVEYQFSRLVQTRIARDEAQYLESLQQAFGADRPWNEESLSVVGMNALEKGFILRIEDAGQVIWDARTHNDGMCRAMLVHMAAVMGSRYPGWNGNYQEEVFPLRTGDAARVTFGYYGPFYFNDAEVEFLNALNQWVLIFGSVVLVGAVLLGAWMARWIASPITRMTQAAQAMRMGHWNQFQTVKSRIGEFGDLAHSINTLGSSLQEQESLRKRMTTDISHELRTPLSVLQARLEGMADGLFPTDQVQLNQCREEVVRLTRLVGQLETLASAEQPVVELRLTKIALSPFLQSLASAFRAEASQKKIRIAVDGPELEFIADEDKTRQILFNLVSNAVKYTREHGKVSLSASVGSEWVELVVEDTGVGIAAEDQPFVFERFYRTDASRTRSSGGSGIGLSIAHSLAVAQGGSISLSSEPGKGSRFVVHLPYQNEKERRPT